MAIELKGFAELEKTLENFPANIKKEVSQEITASALTIVRNAQRAAPVDKGALSRRISFNPISELVVEVSSPTIYSAYMEFGTGDFVSIPLGFEELAARARGAGIRRVNIRPQPFLIPAFQTESPLLLERINNILNESLK